MIKSKKVIVGMSGGVDSAVSAWLLKKAGYDVTGVILKLWENVDEGGKGWGERTCCHIPMVGYLCERIIKIPYIVVDAEKTFKNDVVEEFKAAYKNGETPNPCIACNESVKLPLLRRYAQEAGIPLVATGHYTTWKRSQDFKWTGLSIARDPSKDQSYFLSRTKGLERENTLFPIGSMTKGEVRILAESAGFPVAGLLENQEACFISEKRVSSYMAQEETGKGQAAWTVKTIEGQEIGSIASGVGLTRGQRRGLAIAGGRRLYVHTVDMGKKELLLSEKDELLENTFWVRDPMGPLFDTERAHEGEIHVKFRSTMAPVPCRNQPGEKAHFSLSVPHDGIVEGQVAAFYDKLNVLVGSGIITRKGLSN